MAEISECEFLSHEIECNCYLDFSECCEGYNPTKDLCKWHNDCYFKQLQQYKRCLDEIEKICKDNFCYFADGACDGLGDEILQKVKEVKYNE